MGRKNGRKRGRKSTILTQLKNVQINVQESPTPKIFQKSHFLPTHIFVTIYAANQHFLKNLIFIFFKNSQKKDNLYKIDFGHFYFCPF